MNERYARAKQFALDYLETFARDLWRAEERHKTGGRWNMADPFRPDAKPSNLSLQVNGYRRGAFRDFESGLKGDALDFVAYGLTGRIDADSRRDAVAYIEQKFGIARMDPAELDRLKREAKARQVAAERKFQQEQARNRERARKRFWTSEPIDNTLAVTYLAARGIRFAAVPNPSGALRFFPQATCWKDPGKPVFPAMVAAMVDDQGRIGANHFTFLTPDGRGKAPVEKAKLMYPATRGLAIRLTNGPSGMGAEKAARAGHRDVIALTEGIEDGLTAAMADAELRVWVCGSLAGLGSIYDHAVARAFIVFRDNDWTKPAAVQQFDSNIRRLKTFGKPVEVISVPDAWGKDLNDALNA